VNDQKFFCPSIILGGGGNVSGRQAKNFIPEIPDSKTICLSEGSAKNISGKLLREGKKFDKIIRRQEQEESGVRP
jgi:hypothetical protein